ncbi:Uncharacterised protein [uncultured archaeon]|nr:Uncharacterised protein [uncultured archaeon]
MKYWNKYVATAIVGGGIIGGTYLLPADSYLAFVTGWVVLIPVAVAVFLGYGLREYRKNRKNRITISMKPSEAMKALARREAELQREKELLYEEIRRG